MLQELRWTRNNTTVTGIAAMDGNGNISGSLIANNAPVMLYRITPTANGCPGAPITQRTE
jgi:hypothetical protein